MKDKTYNTLKFCGAVLLPALGVAYNALAEVWKLPYKTEVTQTVMVVVTLLNSLLQKASIDYYQELKKQQDNMKELNDLLDNDVIEEPIEEPKEDPVEETKEFTLLAPVRDGGVTKPFGNGHWGIDYGYVNIPDCNVYAMNDGTVVDVFYNESCGHSIVIQSEFNGKHYWYTFIHLLKAPYYKVGDHVERSTCVGIRGNSGKSNGTHLHCGVTVLTDKTYNWDLMKSLCYDFTNDLRKEKGVTYYGVMFDNMKFM